MKEALILACSQLKRRPGEDLWQIGDSGMAPALLVYAGPHWLILRKQNPKVTAFAISARHGLLAADTPIAYYNTRLSLPLDPQWVERRLLPGAGELRRFDTVWTCTPSRGPYAAAMGVLQAATESEGSPAFRDVVEVLATPGDLDLLERASYFARTRALKLFCVQHGGRGRMPRAESYAEWCRHLASGAVLGYGP